MLYLTCTTITSIDLAHYGVSRAKDWVSVKCGTIALSGFCPGDLINDSAVALCFGIRMGLVLTGRNTIGTGPFCE